MFVVVSLVVVCAFRLFIPFVMFVSFFWFPSLSAWGCVTWGVHSPLTVGRRPASSLLRL